MKREDHVRGRADGCKSGGRRREMIVRDAINYAHDLVVKCGKLDLPHKMEAHNAIDRIEAAYKAETEENAQLKAENDKMKKERDELFRENVRLRSMANGTPDDAAFGRLLTLADWWDANHPFSPDEGKILRKSWAKIVQLQAVNDKMRKALDNASDTMRLVIESAEDVMQPHLVQEICHCGLAIEKTLATEGGAK